MSEWIKVEDRLPVDGEHGLCALHQYDSPGNHLVVTPFTFMDDQFHPFADEDNIENDDYWVEPLYWPTHWKPFPLPPTE